MRIWRLTAFTFALRTQMEKQVLVHGGHELHVHIMGAKAAQYQKGRMGKLPLKHTGTARKPQHPPACTCSSGRSRWGLQGGASA